MNTKLMMGAAHLEAVLNEFVDDLIDSCILDGIFTMHRAIKLDYFDVIAPEQTNEGELLENTSLRLGVNSGRESAKSASCCRCVKCHSKVAATRFAPHLSNCMGLGRNSSRRANKRIAEQQRLEDFDEDADEDSMIDSPLASANISNSDLSASRYPNGNVNKHHSPLKLTISLVSVPGKSENSTKHVVRAVNMNSSVEFPRLPTDSRSIPRSSSKTGTVANKSTVTNIQKSLDPEIVLKEARVTLTNQDFQFPENIPG